MNSDNQIVKNLIHLDAPLLGEVEKQFLADAIDSGYVSTAGKFVNDFENQLCDYLEVEHAVATQSGTAAVHIALTELGIQAGDEVIVPALTFAATINPILYLGAQPVFADVDHNTWCISPQSIERLITDKTKVIIPVHLYGNPAQMAEIMTIAKKHNLRVIEDATESLGAKFMGQNMGTFGDFGALSFNGNKMITTGGGGMVIGQNKKQIEHIRFLINQAKDGDNQHFHPEIGFNYRMTNIEAALGLAQMTRLTTFVEQRQTFYKIYQEELSSINEVTFQEECPDAQSARWLSCINIENGEKVVPELMDYLNEQNIPTRRAFMPATEFPYLKDAQKDDLINTYEIYKNGLCLPSSALNTEDDIRYVCKHIKEFFKK